MDSRLRGNDKEKSMTKKKNKQKNNLYISVTGVMGSGKTTLCKLLAKKLGVPIIEENFKENIFLPLYYEEPKAWALHSQLFCLREKTAQLNELKEMLASSSVIQDTPVYQDVFTYAEAQRTLGYMTKSEHEVYHQFFESFNKGLPKPHLIVQLKADPATLLARIKARGREFEKSISADYLKTLSDLQDKWVKKYPGKVMVVEVNNADKDIMKDKKYQKEVLEKVVEKIKEL